MSLSKVYARALVAALQGDGASDLKSIRTQLEQIWSAIEESRSLRVILLSPACSAREKIAVVRELAKKAGAHPKVTQFVELVIRKGRLGLLGEITNAVDVVRLEAAGGAVGEVMSADPIDPKDVVELSSLFARKVGHPVELKVRVDSTLLAGLKVVLKGVTYDGSLKAQLERMKERFLQGPERVH